MTTFQYIKPTDDQIAVMQQFRDQYETLANSIKVLPSSRGIALALTKLEESGMWLNKALSNND